MKHLRNLIGFTLLWATSQMHGQIHPLGSTCPPTTFTAADFVVAHAPVELRHGPISVTTVTNGCGSCAIVENGPNWPRGTWYGGYSEVVIPLPTFCAGEFGTHPLIRHTEDNARAYLHLHRQTGDGIYLDRLKGGLDYLTNAAQQPNGGFLWWGKRTDCFTGNIAGNIATNYTDGYETSRALRTLTDGYWYLVNTGDPSSSQYYRAIEAAANNVMQLNPGTSNYRGFYAWALVGAYNVTGNRKYLRRARSLAILLQVVNDASGVGIWESGNYEPITACPNMSIWHDTQIWYHLISLRGLIEAYYNLPDVGSMTVVRTPMASTIDNAVNHIIDERFDTGTGQYTRYFINGTPIPPACQTYITYDMEAIALLYYYARGDAHYSPAAVANLRNLLNCVMAGNPSSELEYLKNTGFYSDYTEADITDPSNQLNKKGFVHDEVFHQLAPTVLSSPPNTVYRSENGLSLGTTPVYVGTPAVERWITGDFDGDGFDQLLYQFAGSPIIRRMTNPGVLANSDPQVYPGPLYIDQWITGDFDGDGKDELFYKFLTSTNIFKSDDNLPIAMPTSSPMYSGTAVLEKWIVGDFKSEANGTGNTSSLSNANDELYFKFAAPAANHTHIYEYDLGSTLITSPIPTKVYTGNSTLENWIAGEFISSTTYEQDEILFKWQGSNTLYRRTGTTFASATPICTTCTGTLERWVVGDFDGDMDDELIYKYSGSKAIYNSEDITNIDFPATGVTEIYPATGAYNIENWLVGDFDGNRDDEILNKFAGLNKIYRSDDGLGLGSQIPVYSGNSRLTHWISGNFDGLTNSSKSAAPEPKPENLQAFNLDVFPVPASDLLHVRFETTVAGNVGIELFNLQGQRVYALREQPVEAGQMAFECDRSTFMTKIPDGLYILRVTLNGSSIVKRVVFQQ